MEISKRNPVVIFFESLKSRSQAGVGIAILLAVIIAMIWANSPFNEYYTRFIQTEITLQINGFILSESLLHWVNDGLMAVFFLFVGLELKRELLGGKLSNPRKAILPIGAAIGGMLVPALFYMFFNYGTVSQNGWGIPMATDIAFALGILSLFGNRVPVALKVFLVALAIVDDLGAVLVIAIFYSSGISGMDLFHGFLFFLVLLGGNYLGIRNAWFYGLIGIAGVWLAFFFSGVHPTVAGILIAFAIPGRVKISEKQYLKNLNNLHQRFLEAQPIKGSFISEGQLEILEEIKSKTNDATTPLQKIEHGLSHVVGFFILPVFALVNAGIHIHGDIPNILSQNISLGIAFGLIAGKFIGIIGVAWILLKLKIAQLEDNINWGQICGVALLAGIGFTMSIFVTDLAFQNEELKFVAKLSILFTSTVAGILGSLVIWISSKSKDGNYTREKNIQMF